MTITLSVKVTGMSIVLVLLVPIAFALFPIWMDKLESIVLRYDDASDANLSTPPAS